MVSLQGGFYIPLVRSKPKLKNRLTFFKADITKEIDLKKILTFFKKKKIKIDVLINCAAKDHIPTKTNNNKEKLDLENFSQKVWIDDLNVGLTGSLLTTKIFGSYMAIKKSGVILNISSDLSVISPDQRLYRKEGVENDRQPVKPITYSVIKAGLIGMTKYLSTYWADKGVRCNALSPGGIYNGQGEDFVNKLESLIPVGRMAHVDEYKSSVQYLCSDASSYMTGSVVTVDGGHLQSTL